MAKSCPGETMSSRERFMAALYGKKVDRIPVGNPTSIATRESMEACDAYFPDVHLDANKMATLAATGYELLGFDSIAPYFSVQQEAAAFGCKMNWGSIDSMPDVLDNPYDDPDSVKITPDFLDQPSTATVIEALRLLKKEYGDHVCLIGKVMGPWTLSYHFYGVQKFLMDTILDPDKVRRFLQKLKEFLFCLPTPNLSGGRCGNLLTMLPVIWSAPIPTGTFAAGAPGYYQAHQRALNPAYLRQHYRPPAVYCRSRV